MTGENSEAWNSNESKLISERGRYGKVWGVVTNQAKYVGFIFRSRLVMVRKT
jgi:hypothetical protein